MIYKFSTSDFEGPLDLLLHLIKENKMEISSINVESITNQYLTFINKMKEEIVQFLKGNHTLITNYEKSRTKN